MVEFLPFDVVVTRSSPTSEFGEFDVFSPHVQALGALGKLAEGMSRFSTCKSIRPPAPKLSGVHCASSVSRVIKLWVKGARRRCDTKRSEEANETTDRRVEGNGKARARVEKMGARSRTARKNSAHDPFLTDCIIRRWRKDEVMDGSDLKAQVLLQSAAAAAVLSLPRIGICEEGNAT